MHKHVSKFEEQMQIFRETLGNIRAQKKCRSHILYPLTSRVSHLNVLASCAPEEVSAKNMFARAGRVFVRRMKCRNSGCSEITHFR